MQTNYIFINAKEHKVETLPLNLGADGSYKTIQKILGVDCFTSAPTQVEDITLLVDDEGLINGTNDFFEIEGLTFHPLAGNALIVGVDEEGETIAPNFQINESKVRFFNKLQVYLKNCLS